MDLALVVPVVDMEFGQRPVAFVRWKGESISDDELLTYLRGRVARFKIPDCFFQWPQENSGDGFKLNRAHFKN